MLGEMRSASGNTLLRMVATANVLRTLLSRKR